MIVKNYNKSNISYITFDLKKSDLISQVTLNKNSTIKIVENITVEKLLAVLKTVDFDIVKLYFR